MPFKKGNPGGPGRPKGSRDKKQVAMANAIIDSGLTPLAFFAQVYQDQTKLLEDRLEAAKAAAPYIHQKMPTKIDLGGELSIIPPMLPKKRAAE